MLFGAHCSGGIKKALEKGEAMGAEAVQLFVQSPRTWRFPDHDPKDLERFRERRTELDLPALVHSLYLVNLAAPDDEIYRKSVDTMRSTVDAACAIDADAVVFHVGSHQGPGFEAGLERVVPALAEALERCSETTWLCMENAAGTGDTVGRSLDELVAVYDAAGRHERLGVFLAHPRFQGLPALLEVPGEGHGPDAEQMRRLKELYGSATTRGSGRRRGTTAGRPAARGTRG